MEQYIIFHLADKKYALPIEQVQSVIRAVKVHSLDKKPQHILGTINFHGTMIYLLNLRVLLDLPSKNIELSDNILICNMENARVALLVEYIDGIADCEKKPMEKEEKIPIPDTFKDYIQYNDEILYILNLKSLISKTNTHHTVSEASS